MLKNINAIRLLCAVILLSSFYLTGCTSPGERMDALRDECDGYNKPRGFNDNPACRNLPQVTSSTAE